MSDTRTAVEIKTAALRTLLSLDPSQDPAPEDIETIGEFYTKLLKHLAALEIIYIADEDGVPSEYALVIEGLLANFAGPRYGSPMNDPARLRDESILRQMTSARPTYETLKVDYF